MIIGQECPHTSERIEHFLSIRLEIKNKKTIYQALDEFIKGEILEGDNAYYCEKCSKKVKALKRVCLKDLPPVMIVTLKRFEFDFDTM
jgi:ubiquitin C-terminal hydrolase